MSFADLRHRQVGQRAADARRHRHALAQAEDEAGDRIHAAPGTGEAGQGDDELPPPQDSIATAGNPTGPNRRSSGARACAPTPTRMTTIRTTTRDRSGRHRRHRASDQSVKKIGEPGAPPRARHRRPAADCKTQREEFKQQLARRPSRAARRRANILSEPPLEYRQACRRRAGRRTRRGRIQEGTPPEGRGAQEGRRFSLERSQPVLIGCDCSGRRRAARGRSRSAFRPTVSRPMPG